jgi:hypothetical protein
MSETVVKRTRKRKVPALMKLTIERIEMDDTPADEMFRKVIVLEQSFPESKFDLAKVIKAINGL